MAQTRTVLALVVVMCSVLMQSTNAMIHVVGGTTGWELPPNPHFYEDWAKTKTFHVGDKLVFPFRMGAHNVIQVNKADYDTCGHDNIINMFHQGPLVFQMTTPGDYYFYSMVGPHCHLGQKLHVHVDGSKALPGRKARLLELA